MSQNKTYSAPSADNSNTRIPLLPLAVSSNVVRAARLGGSVLSGALNTANRASNLLLSVRHGLSSSQRQEARRREERMAELAEQMRNVRPQTVFRLKQLLTAGRPSR